MATQSLYRRYRPRRFSELKGQDHIVRALRTSVAEGREGQAYLFSGPRGTGKTTTARIMAKVLNCQNPADGEPCCECESCLSVQAGTSYDVHELDAASNNGVEAMRDLIEKASLGTPGRHKVYILDEVHMLSKGAEAALLKTLEEPPPHVVFVLATTDPQKMSDTIRSRTQHLQFHLLAPDTLQEHVRWVAEDAGLTVTEEAIEQVVAQGAGSPRDTLSFLELASNAGGDAAEVIALDEFVESMIDHDPGRALKMVAHAISRGRDPRTVTEELVAFLRNGFLALMAPDLVQLPSQRIEALTDLARRLGAAGLVRGIETLGEALTEMRQAPDPRVLLDVATVQLTSEQVGASDIASLVARIQKLERAVADGVPAAGGTPAAGGGAAPAPAAPVSKPAPVDPATGRAKLGSRAAAAAPPTAAPAPSPEGSPAPSPSPAPGAAAPVEVPAKSTSAEPTPAPAEATSASAEPAAATAPSALGEASTSAPAVDTARAPDAAPVGGQISASVWETVRPQLRGMARAVYSPVTYVSSSQGAVTLAAPNDAHRSKCEQHRDAVEAALSEHERAPVTVQLVVGGDDGGRNDRGSDDTGSNDGASNDGGSIDGASIDRSGRGGGPATPGAPGASPGSAAPRRPTPASGAQASDTSDVSGSMSTGALAHDRDPSPSPSPSPSPGAESAHLSVVPDDADAPDATESAPIANGRAIAEEARHRGPEPDPDEGLQRLADTLPDDEDVDLDDLVDAPPETVKTPIDRLAEAFPGSEMVDDVY